MKRYLPFLLMLPLGMHAYACSSNSSDNGGGTATPPGGEPGPGGSSGNPGPGGSSGNPNPGGPGDDPNQNPIEGIEAPKVFYQVDTYTDGPIWSADQKVFFYTAPYGGGGVYRIRTDASIKKIREGFIGSTDGNVQIGNTIDKAGNLITIDQLDVVRASAADAGVPEMVANGFVDKGTFQKFDTLNDGVVGKDGSIYVTDPGYTPTVQSNRIYRILPDKSVTVVDSFDDVPRPNGIAFNPDQSELYVGFGQPAGTALPFIRKYHMADDGTLGEASKFVDIDPVDSSPDGIEVDTHGNLYVATKQGILVYKSDATKLGVIALPEVPTGMAFGGDDMKTLFITSAGANLWQVKVKVAGIAQ